MLQGMVDQLGTIVGERSLSLNALGVHSQAIQFSDVPGGNADLAPEGSHVVLEATCGALLHAIRLADCFMALRAGSVKTFRIKRPLETAAVVEYPPPMGPSNEKERKQAAARARLLLGHHADAVRKALIDFGADEHAMDAGGEPYVSECLASFCITGTAHHWKIADAYRLRHHTWSLEMGAHCAEGLPDTFDMATLQTKFKEISTEISVVRDHMKTIQKNLPHVATGASD